MSRLTTTVNLKPWPVPDHATVELPPQPKQAGMQALPTIPLGELDPDALDNLAQEWLDNLYANVKRRSPFYSTAKDRAA